MQKQKQALNIRQHKQNNTIDFNERNEVILDFFEKNQIHGIRLINDILDPHFIYRNKVSLSIKVVYWNLYFQDSFTINPNNLLVVNLRKDTNIDYKQELLNVFKSIDSIKVYTLMLVNTDLFLVGYNFYDKKNEMTKYPVFARYDPKIYFSRRKAELVTKELTEYMFEIQ